MTNLAVEIGGFSPVVRSMIPDVGVMASVVFGHVWFHCQVKGEQCTIGIDTLVEELRVDRTTIMRHIKTLETKGYLCDHTPSLRGRPHTYSITGKAGLKASIKSIDSQIVEIIITGE